jgi:acyl-CoA reductase-like NAD-dependent aldehyde dehydrogenase/nicotinamidase-related amidase
MKPALVLVDLQHDFLHIAGLEPAAGLIVEHAATLLRSCREMGVPVLHVRTAVSRTDDRRMPHWKLAERWSCEQGTPGCEPPDALRQIEGEPIVEKTFFSAFSNTTLETALRERGCDALILAGVHLHACVRQAALDAYQRGFQVCVAEDAAGSNDPVHAAITRRYLEDRGMRFATVASLLHDLRQGRLPAHDPALRDQAAIASRAARSALEAWRKTTLPQRNAMLERLAAALVEHAPSLTDEMVRTIGKPARYGRPEALRTAEMLHAVIRRIAGAPASASCSAFTVRRVPHGVVALVTPWNNPVYIPLGKIAPALLCGNTVVWKPAPAADKISLRLWDALRSAGVPEGVVSLVQGDAVTAREIISSSDVDAVSFTGASAAGYGVQEICSARRIPLQAELGGNNAAIVWPDCDLTAAAEHIAAGAFGMAGQRCTANRRVIVHESCLKTFLDELVKATMALKWGAPLDAETHVGPLVSAEHAARVAALIERCKPHAARIITPHGSDVAEPAPGFPGAWHPPTIVCCDDARSEIVQEETFGPVLVLQTARDWDHAITLCNGVRQGLAASVFTASRSLADAFLAQARAGILKVNQSTADAAVDAPFGGWKASGVGPPEHGDCDIEFYTRTQTAYHDPNLLP